MPTIAGRSPAPALVVVLLAALSTGCASRAVPRVAGGPSDLDAYLTAREQLVAQERALRVGADLVLSPTEMEADRRLRLLCEEEKERTGADFPPAHSFLEAKTRQLIEGSPVLAAMKRLPKGGILHGHGEAVGDFRWLVGQVVARSDTYMYVGESGPQPRGTLRIFATAPGAGWESVASLRAAAGDAAAFDESVYRALTLGSEDLASPDIWAEFGNCFRRSFALFDDDPTLEAAFWRRMLDSLIDENVQYLESRSWPAGGDDLLGAARRRDPDFDVKFIPSAGRSADHRRVAEVLDRVLAAREHDPDRVVGFDLVENEDRTHSNLYFAEELLAARREAVRLGTDLPLYLHSGESNSAENENLYDALLLGTRRIGHGLALVRHPLLMQMVKERGIAIEVCPISNQVLGYVADLRTHPAATYVAAGLPVVLAPDDPGLMRESLSHDYYEAFMAWGLDLRALKQIAMNSLAYSAMTPDEKRHALAVWHGRWDAFVQWLSTAALGDAPSTAAALGHAPRDLGRARRVLAQAEGVEHLVDERVGALAVGEPAEARPAHEHRGPPGGEGGRSR